jgi:hypothetical protein
MAFPKTIVSRFNITGNLARTVPFERNHFIGCSMAKRIQLRLCTRYPAQRPEMLRCQGGDVAFGLSVSRDQGNCREANSCGIAGALDNREARATGKLLAPPSRGLKTQTAYSIASVDRDELR